MAAAAEQSLTLLTKHHKNCSTFSNIFLLIISTNAADTTLNFSIGKFQNYYIGAFLHFMFLFGTKSVENLCAVKKKKNILLFVLSSGLYCQGRGVLSFIYKNISWRKKHDNDRKQNLLCELYASCLNSKHIER